jgi:transcription initiation factor TFIIIB Brf1 subunit/transcription initiation factor TFIIB
MCEHCGGRRQYDVFDDLPVCIDCGRVDYEFISEEPEWRSGGDEGKADPSRVGAPVNTDHFSAAWGASTIMSVAKQASYQQKRLAMINLHNSMNHRDRALFHAYQELDRIGKEVLKLPASIMYIIKIKYKAFNEAVLTRGAVRNGIKANCVFQACREAGVSRTTQEIADAFGIPARDLARTFDMYQEQLPETEVHITTAADVIPRFFNDITCVPESQRGRIKMKIVNVAKEMAECVELQGRTPKAVACAIIFVILKEAGLTPDKAELCKICGVSVPTLTKIEAIVRKLRNSNV